MEEENNSNQKLKPLLIREDSSAVAYFMQILD